MNISIDFDLPEEIEVQIQKEWNDSIRLELGTLTANQKLLLKRCKMYSQYRLQDQKMIAALTDRAELLEQDNRNLRNQIDLLLKNTNNKKSVKKEALNGN